MDIESNKIQDNSQSKNDYFKRQKTIPGWNQEIVSNTTALVLGAGGLGSCVSIQLMRLGIKKLILVDYDVVDYHNLNRQIMFTINDIGKSKVESAKQNLQFHNISNTEIETHNINAVTQWEQIVALAKQSNLVFNLIDYGDYFDLAVCSLCIKLSLPMFQGGTFCNSLSVDYFTSDGRPCLLCLTDGLKKEFIEKLNPSLILEYKSLEFLPKNDNPEGQSNIVICQMCANFINTFVLNELFPSGQKKSKRILLYLDPIDIISFDLEITPKCPYCREPFHEGNSFHEVQSEEIPLSKEDLWKDIKNLQLQKLFPQYVQEIQVIEGSLGQIDSKLQITYKDGAKWTVQLVEISSIKQTIVYDVIQTQPQFSCKKFRNIFQISQPDNQNALNTCELLWRTEFQDDITINAYEDTKYKKYDYFKNLIETIITNSKNEEDQNKQQKQQQS
ncbi:ThiF family protein (macronuclear) [Tetrahymena thermophila SB210]|uniref:ThiF family protein n=1 Tax=Tetrahymena thermophila (strain SB210) TaxID=312017 RepID=I7M9Y9_TETTS|nr:ThiF family protein [Tetrahymena thermophila SB210]EAS03074.1 ThiF family protein [Tetrahymena thermophila SB210]|eukprot:XP_001023319.1 ThiF family protein [Tetrahymena thermophila SB210]